MSSVSKKSSAAVVVPLVQRLPASVASVDLNFCRNLARALYGVLPDPFKRPNGSRPVPPGVPRGAVPGGKHKELYKCPSCRTTFRVKNNRAVVKQHERLRRLRDIDPCAPACRTADCAKTFSTGKPAQRHKRSDKNRLVLDMLCNDLSLAKTSKISGLSYRDIYRRIGFYHGQVRSFVARREDFSRIDFRQVGSRFATDSQALTTNWPSRKWRFPVVFQHLFAAHARSGLTMEASFRFDPEILPLEAEARSLAASEDHISTAFRRPTRTWAKTEFDAYLVRLAKAAELPQVEEYGLPAIGSMLRYDVMQFAQTMRLRDHIGQTEASLIFVMDGDARLKQSVSTIFQPEVSAGPAHLAIIDFDKAMTNYMRNCVVADGRTDLCAATGLTPTELSLISDSNLNLKNHPTIWCRCALKP